MWLLWNSYPCTHLIRWGYNSVLPISNFKTNIIVRSMSSSSFSARQFIENHRVLLYDAHFVQSNFVRPSRSSLFNETFNTLYCFTDFAVIRTILILLNCLRTVVQNNVPTKWTKTDLGEYAIMYSQMSVPLFNLSYYVPTRST